MALGAFPGKSGQKPSCRVRVSNPNCRIQEQRSSHLSHWAFYTGRVPKGVLQLQNNLSRLYGDLRGATIAQNDRKTTRNAMVPATVPAGDGVTPKNDAKVKRLQHLLARPSLGLQKPSTAQNDRQNTRNPMVTSNGLDSPEKRVEIGGRLELQNIKKL